MDPYLAEIRLLPFDFAPRGWARCDGAKMAIQQNTALFSILGTYYGGDGQKDFALPDMRDRVPIGTGEDGQGNSYSVGETGGAAAVKLTADELPVHPHRLQVSTAPAKERQPPNQLFARGTGVAMYDDKSKPTTLMHERMVTEIGGGEPHNNLMPYVAVPYFIALQGVFPNRP